MLKLGCLFLAQNSLIEFERRKIVKSKNEQFVDCTPLQPTRTGVRGQGRGQGPLVVVASLGVGLGDTRS